MTFAILPRIELNWDATEEDPEEWVYWSLYRQEAGDDSTLIRIAVIRQADITFYYDFAAKSGITYHYYLSQTIDNGSNEVESGLAGPVVGTVTCLSVFIHDAASPGHYVELPALALRERNPRDLTFQRARASEDDVAFVGAYRGQDVALNWTDSWRDESPEPFAATLELLDRMISNGSTMMLRQELVPGMFCIGEIDRQARGVLHSPSVTLRKVKYQEAV